MPHSHIRPLIYNGFSVNKNKEHWVGHGQTLCVCVCVCVCAHDHVVSFTGNALDPEGTESNDLHFCVKENDQSCRCVV